MTSYGEDTFTLFLRVQSAQNLSTRAGAAFCTMLVWSNSSKGGLGKSTTQPKCTTLKRIRGNQPVEWNEELQVTVTDPATEVLTVRVKDQGDSLVASCNIYLAHLRPGQALNQWFQLHPSGHICLKLVLNPNQRIPSRNLTPVNNSPYSTEFQALLELELKKRAATTNQSPLPANIAALVEMQNKAQENAWLVANQRIQQQQQAFNNQLQAQNAARYQQQSRAPSFHEMMGTAANASTIAANLQQLNGGGNAGVGTGGLGTVASIALGAFGLGPLGALFGSS
uniref:C2 domain-containing protein n=1 Tax=Phytophthora ramorum TaxID=164328 RepID=H3GUD9_PHYRM